MDFEHILFYNNDPSVLAVLKQKKRRKKMAFTIGRTYDGIVKDFKKIRDRLEILVQDKTVEEDTLTMQAREIQARKDEALSEKRKAEHTIGKLDDFLAD